MTRENGRHELVVGEDETELSSSQWQALRARLLGKSVREAAEAADVHASTVHRWHREDLEYRTVYNQLRQAQRERFQQELMNAASEAVEAVTRSVEAGDIDRAFRLLEGLGLLSGRLPPVGPTSTAEMKQQVFLRGLELRVPGPDGRPE